jgi:hypothetical protein
LDVAVSVVESGPAMPSNLAVDRALADLELAQEADTND